MKTKFVVSFVLSLMLGLLIVSIILNLHSFNVWVVNLDPKILDFYKTAGTIFAAITAATVTGLIQYQQWKTATTSVKVAHNKLKLDLFAHRYEIHQGIMNALMQMTSGTFTDDNEKILLTYVQKVRWVFNEEIYEYIRKNIVVDSVVYAKKIQVILESAEEYSGKQQELNAAQEELWDYLNPILKKRNEMLLPYMKVSESLNDPLA